jgi:hypothetical protein
MISETNVREMTLSQKLRLMEILWGELHRESESFESPGWHKKELEETEARRKAGLEEPMDWDEAKGQLMSL